MSEEHVKTVVLDTPLQRHSNGLQHQQPVNDNDNESDSELVESADRPLASWLS